MRPRPEPLLVFALAAVGAAWLWPEMHGSTSRRPDAVPASSPESIAAPLAGVSSSAPASADRRGPPSVREASRPEPAEVSEVSLAPASRGQLVDEVTLEPIPDALVATSERNDWTDANGWFDTGDSLEQLEAGRAVHSRRRTEGVARFAARVPA